MNTLVYTVCPRNSDLFYMVPKLLNKIGHYFLDTQYYGTFGFAGLLTGFFYPVNGRISNSVPGLYGYPAHRISKMLISAVLDIRLSDIYDTDIRCIR